jgi:uncharacterized protein with NRDE domain
MCTVSYIPAGDKIFITSNRDEKLSRKNASAPVLSVYNGYKLIYPKDGNAGGTWIVMKENGDAAVLLNGAFIRHLPDPPYRVSRGIVLLDIIATERPSLTFSKTNLQDVEPFTIVLFESQNLYEFRWDGNEKFHRQLDAAKPFVWSSATLYDGFVIKKREQWFETFLSSNTQPTHLDILNFHRFTGDGDRHNDLLMTRDGIYSTVSITGILLTRDRGFMKYIDIKNGRSSEIKIELLHSSHTIE